MSLSLDKSPRVIDTKYIEWITTQVCMVCRAPHPHPHHIIGHGFGGEGMKADDYLAIPLCHKHHTGDFGVHQIGHMTWEWKYGCQMKMTVVTLLKALTEQKVSKEVCQTYLLKLEPFLGMTYINQQILNTQQRGINYG